MRYSGRVYFQSQVSEMRIKKVHLFILAICEIILKSDALGECPKKLSEYQMKVANFAVILLKSFSEV